ncbi:hypothetical protein WMY93_018653 [Mugilogobius chulae]|uniref:Protein NDNF n=1 Tax=Mugilogobius chulae TaxID=88201 RepID=A0AAW0NWR9_9GOBI
MIPRPLSWSFGAVLMLCWSSLWPQVRSRFHQRTRCLFDHHMAARGKDHPRKAAQGEDCQAVLHPKEKDTRNDKPFKSLQWITKKSTPEVWWRGPGTEEKIHSFSGNSMNTFTGRSNPHASVYILRLRSKQHNSKATVYLQDGPGRSGAFPLLPNDTHVHTLGVGMTSVTLNWSPSPSLTSHKGYEYCVLVNSKNNYPSMCAAQENIRKKIQEIQNKLNSTSAAYTGTYARTHEEARPDITTLREGELRWVNFPDRSFNSEQFFSFRPRGLQQSGLLTLQSCGKDEKSSRTYSLSENADILRLSQKRCSSLPSTLQIKSFNKLRTCNSVTIAWMGTEERSLYCVYRRKLDSQEADSGKAIALNAPCLGPESRSDTERVLCKYFQELNPRRAVTTAVISGLESGMAYVFDVYLMRRWGIPIKYTSKMVKTRRDC